MSNIPSVDLKVQVGLLFYHLWASNIDVLKTQSWNFRAIPSRHYFFDFDPRSISQLQLKGSNIGRTPRLYQLTLEGFCSLLRRNYLSLEAIHLFGGGDARSGGIQSRLFCDIICQRIRLFHCCKLLVNKVSRYTCGNKSKESDQNTKRPIANCFSFERAEFVVLDDSDKQWFQNVGSFLLGLLLCGLCCEFTLGGRWYRWCGGLYLRLSGHRFSDRERALISVAWFIGGGVILRVHSILEIVTRAHANGE